MAAKVEGDVIFRADQGSNAADIWDDSALIEAYDRAVNLIKSGDLSSSKRKGGRNRKKQSAKRNGSNKKESNKTEETEPLFTWEVGDACKAIFTEDEIVYDALIVSIDTDTQTCVVMYTEYGNREQQDLKDLLPPDAQNGSHEAKTGIDREWGENDVDSPHYPMDAHTSMEWNGESSAAQWVISDLCLAPEHPSGHMHQAVINTFPTAYTCRVTFIRSKKSQEVNISSLQHINNQTNQHRTQPQHQYNRTPFDYRHAPPFPPQGGPLAHHMPQPWQQHAMPGHYPFPPPMPLSRGQFPHPPMPHIRGEIPHPPMPPVPPHPLGTPGNGEDTALASMLMSWYLSGYHTGYYQGLQQSKLRCHTASQTQQVSMETTTTAPMVDTRQNKQQSDNHENS